MSRVDCSKTLNYVKEFTRMCKEYADDSLYCSNSCPLNEMEGCEVIHITQEHINIVQKWSDENPIETLMDRFYKMFPNAPRNPQNLQPMACPYQLGWYEEDGCPEMSCEDCWNRPYIEK